MLLLYNLLLGEHRQKKAGVAVWCCPCLLNWRSVSDSSHPRIPRVKEIKQLYKQRVQIGSLVSSRTVRWHSRAASAEKVFLKKKMIKAALLLRYLPNQFSLSHDWYGFMHLKEKKKKVELMLYGQTILTNIFNVRLD